MKTQTTGNSGLRKICAVALAAATTAGAAGCAALPQGSGSLQVRDTFQTLNPQVEVVPNALGKLPLLQQIQQTTVNNPPTCTFTPQGGEVCAPGGTSVQYAPATQANIGVNLGDGLFFDRNGNLSYVPWNADEGSLIKSGFSQVTIGSSATINKTGNQQWQISEKGLFGAGNSTIYYDKQGGLHLPSSGGGEAIVYKQNDPNHPGYSDLILEQTSTPGIIQINQASDKEIKINAYGNETTLAKSGTPAQDTLQISSSQGNTTLVQNTGNAITVNPGGMIISKNGNTILQGNNTLSISNQGKTIVIQNHGLFGGTTTIHVK